MQIHSRKMNVSPDVNFEELSRSTDDFNGAQCKAVCVEAVSITHSSFEEFYASLIKPSFLLQVFFVHNYHFYYCFQQCFIFIV